MAFKKLSECRKDWRTHLEWKGQKAKRPWGRQGLGVCKDRQKAGAASPDCGHQQVDVRAVRGSLQGTGNSLECSRST